MTVQIVHGKIDYPYTVRHDTELVGMITHDTTVLSGATLLVRGTITANLFIQPGATAVIRGMVNGCVHNAGHAEIYGMIDNLVEDAGCNSKIGPDAIIRKRC